MYFKKYFAIFGSLIFMVACQDNNGTQQDQGVVVTGGQPTIFHH